MLEYGQRRAGTRKSAGIAFIGNIQYNDVVDFSPLYMRKNVVRALATAPILFYNVITTH